MLGIPSWRIHDAVVSSVESALEVRVDAVEVNFCVLHHHVDGGEGVVDAAKELESVFFHAEDAVDFCVLRGCVFD
jgi:hypothetical protein